MNEIQQALAEVMDKYGHTDRRGRRTAKIALHRIEEYNLVNANALMNLVYARDERDEYKYSVRRVDEIVNLEVWQEKL